MPFDPDNLPWRYRDDAYYQKGSFNVSFLIEPESPELDATARRRALQQLLLALRDETSLKVSSYIDVWDHQRNLEPPAELDRDHEAAADPDEDLSAQAEFAIYNKLGVTSLSKLRRFMEQHLLGDVTPRITLVDPETGLKFKATHFVIRYLFQEFVAHWGQNDWERLRELMSQDDRGYGELMGRGQPRGAAMQRPHYLFNGRLYRLAGNARRYEGPPLEEGGTSRKGPPVKTVVGPVRKLIAQGVLVPGESKIADIGAGKFSRNTDELRRMGFDVYASDPNHGTGVSGWEGTSIDPPTGQFDLVFTSYVLNVVPEYVEDQILADADALSPRQIHVTRNRDVRNMATQAIYRYMDGATDPNAVLVGEFFLNKFADQDMLAAYQDGILYEEDMQELAEHGLPTTDGFQRIPILNDKGYQQTHDSTGYKVYTKGV